MPIVSLIVRVATEAAALAFALSALAIYWVYTAVFSVHTGDAVAPAVALGVVASATVFIAVSVLVQERLSRKRPVFGAKRGAFVGVMAVVAVASAHACFTFGSAGLLHSLLGQVGYACLVGGVPAAIAGALLGRSIDNRIASASDA